MKKVQNRKKYFVFDGWATWKCGGQQLHLHLHRQQHHMSSIVEILYCLSTYTHDDEHVLVNNIV